jgi:PAT family beta-lactamase induction signal transducer AmpG
MLLAAGGVIWEAGRHGWGTAWTGAAAVFGLIAVAAMLAPGGSSKDVAREPLQEPLADLLRRRDIGVILLFALLFKIDIAALDPMTKPFWTDRGLTLEVIGSTITTGRLIATVLGATIGGVLTSRWGIFPALWRLGAVQALSSLGYAAAAAATASLPVILAAAFFENFAAGLGTAVFLAFLMAVCKRQYAATQFAVLSALVALSRSAASWASGRVAEHTGYTQYFLLTFLIGLPAFALLPRLRRTLDVGEVPAGR